MATPTTGKTVMSFHANMSTFHVNLVPDFSNNCMGTSLQVCNNLRILHVYDVITWQSEGYNELALLNQRD